MGRRSELLGTPFYQSESPKEESRGVHGDYWEGQKVPGDLYKTPGEEEESPKRVSRRGERNLLFPVKGGNPSEDEKGSPTAVAPRAGATRDEAGTGRLYSVEPGSRGFGCSRSTNHICGTLAGTAMGRSESSQLLKARLNKKRILPSG